MGRHYRWLAIIILIAAFTFWVNLPNTTGIKLDFDNDGTLDVNFDVRQVLGLDLVGGLRVLLQAEIPADQIDAQDLQQTVDNVSRRVNGLGLVDATVQVQGNNRILVEIPGIDETTKQQAIDTIQQTALLEFVDFTNLDSNQVSALIGQKVRTSEQVRIQQARIENANGTEVPELIGATDPSTGLPFTTVMTGGELQAASPSYNTQAQQYVVQFELTSEGGKIFGEFTGSHQGKALAIVLDGTVVSAPRINARIDSGGIIEGGYVGDEGRQEAQQLALQLRSGALPIPLRVEGSAFVGATLGQQSVNLSVRAGIIGVIIVLTFMLIYYRVSGVAADFALIVFILLNFASFKIIPITLTLPAITGFLISIGTAVDGNILIFERIKEELRSKKPLDEALESGFNRAWVSIRDSNFSTILICGVLFLFGLTPGASIVSGFAVTLALGLVINLFTAVIVTRTFLYILVNWFKQPLTERHWLLGV